MRIPLHIKLMVSYLLVVGLVFLPTFVYLRTIQKRELRANVERDLRAEVTRLAAHLGRVPPNEFTSVVENVLAMSARRVTIIEPDGHVIGDSVAVGRTLDDHSQRPEVRAALDGPDGFGVAMRRSATTGEMLLYSAVRFPAVGPVRGVVRVAVPTSFVGSTERKSSSFLSRAGAVALSAAVLLSLVAALVVSRPLRRITDAARAFAAGDFGHPIDVSSHDELGEAAAALGELAAQLRGRLLASGADRAALHALLDDLPIGVILYDPRGAPVVINGRARELCDLPPNQELERARQLVELPDQAPVVERVLRDGFTLEAPLVLPWQPDAPLRARWISIFAPDGDRQPALVVHDGASERRLERANEALTWAGERLRHAARRAPADAAELARAAEACEELLPRTFPRPGEVSAVAIGDVCARAQAEVAPFAEPDGVRIELTLADGQIHVVEAGGRTRRAVRALLGAALKGAERGQVLRLRGDVEDARVRLSVLTGRPPPGLEHVAAHVQCLGGDAGAARVGDATESWLLLPRA